MNDAKRLELKWRVLAILIGAVGAFGEAGILRHELVQTLPYKITSEHELFLVIASKAFYAAPLIACSIAWLATDKSAKWGSLVAVALCPILFTLAYVGVFSWVGIRWTSEIGFDGLTHWDLLMSFVVQAAKLSIVGAAIGFLCGWSIDIFVKKRRSLQ